jgi:hypothetical protein
MARIGSRIHSSPSARIGGRRVKPVRCGSAARGRLDGRTQTRQSGRIALISVIEGCHLRAVAPVAREMDHPTHQRVGEPAAIGRGPFGARDVD